MVVLHGKFMPNMQNLLELKTLPVACTTTVTVIDDCKGTLQFVEYLTIVIYVPS
jgi:hypothetical protein